MRRRIALLVLVVGALLSARSLYLHAKAELAGILIRRAWEQSLASGKSPAPWPWADTHPIARLRIPRIGYDEIVLEGATPRTLAFGPARLMSGAVPGERGNLVLAGHRTSWFRPLQNVVQGDEIDLQWAGPHSQSYVVDDVRIVDPEDLTILAPTTEDALTLITCYPFGPGPRSPQRFVLRASPTTPATERLGRSP
jgi:sortase A